MKKLINKPIAAACTLILVLLLNACREKGDCCSVMDTRFDIRVLNQAGQSLLNPKTPNAYSTQDIELSAMLNGREPAFYKADATTNPILRFEKQASADEDYLVMIMPNVPDNRDNIATHIIKWRAGDQDTLDCLVMRTGGNVTCEKIWFNGQVKFDNLSNPKIVDKPGSGRFFQVIK